MSNQYIGELRAFSFNFAPRGWALCNGQTLPINQNQALFSLLGTNYGGDGITTFQLPNMQGRVALSQGSSPASGTNYVVGQIVGASTQALAVTQIPQHTHNVSALANPTSGQTNIPSSSVVLASASSSASGNPPVSIYDTSTPTTAMLPLGNNGSGAAHENRMPYLTMSYCIALLGIFPSRN